MCVQLFERSSFIPFPNVRWLRMEWLEYIHSSTIESSVSSVLGFASIARSSTTCSLWEKLDTIGYLKRAFHILP